MVAMSVDRSSCRVVVVVAVEVMGEVTAGVGVGVVAEVTVAVAVVVNEELECCWVCEWEEWGLWEEWKVEFESKKVEDDVECALDFIKVCVSVAWTLADKSAGVVAIVVAEVAEWAPPPGDADLESVVGI
jgi:hypothetical protein